MGTEIQSDAFFPGYYSARDLNDNGGSGNWASFNGNESLKSGPCYDSVLARSAMDRYLEYDKEQLRLTILKHESIFRDQLRELHRLYRRQRDLMSEIERRELKNVPAETSPSSLSLLHIPSQDANKSWNVSKASFLEPSFGRPSMSETNIAKQTYPPSLFPSQDRVISKDKGSLEPKFNMFQKRVSGSGFSANLCTSGNGKQLEEILFGVPGVNSNSLNQNSLVTRTSEINLIGGDGLISRGKNGTSGSKLYTAKSCGIDDLNEPIRGEAASINYFENSTCVTNQSEANPRRARKIFGIEISEETNFPVSDSGTPNMHIPTPHSNAAYPVSSNIFPWRKPANCLGHNAALVQKNPCARSCGISGKNSSVQGSDIFRESLKSSSGSRAEILHPAGGELAQRNEYVHHLNLDSLESCYRKLSDKTKMEKDPTQYLVQASASETCMTDAEVKKIEESDPPSSQKIRVFPNCGVLHTSEDHDCKSVDGGATSGKDLAHDYKSGDPIEVDHSTWKGVTDCGSGLRSHIDLNLSPYEEEAPSTPSIPEAMKTSAIEIDLEAPTVLESEFEPSPEEDFVRDQINKPSILLPDESEEPRDSLVLVAAEAIVAISSSRATEHVDDTFHHPFEASSTSYLHWFADIVSSQNGDLKGETEVISVGTNGAHLEESVPVGMDYFEFMTLQLTETKAEEFLYKPSTAEEPKDADTGKTSPLKRPRRGQARKGRQQRKDFQRDILPSLVSLTRQELMEDLQTIEALLKADGCTWQSSAAKYGRRRKRLDGSTHALATTTTICSNQLQRPSHREVGLEDKSLTGWGKRTKRVPRQRCRAGNFSVSMKCRVTVKS